MIVPAGEGAGGSFHCLISPLFPLQKKGNHRKRKREKTHLNWMSERNSLTTSTWWGSGEGVGWKFWRRRMNRKRHEDDQGEEKERVFHGSAVDSDCLNTLGKYMKIFGWRKDKLKLDIMRTGNSNPLPKYSRYSSDFRARFTEISSGRGKTSSNEESWFQRWWPAVFQSIEMVLFSILDKRKKFPGCTPLQKKLIVSK